MTMAVQTYQAFNIDLTSLIYESAIKLFLCLPFDIVELPGNNVAVPKVDSNRGDGRAAGHHKGCPAALPC
jgi:hypothetical protein